MKKKLTLAKRPMLPKGPRPDPPLKADELIDLLERHYNQTVKLMDNIVHNTLPALLFLELAIDRDEPPEELVVHLKDRAVHYCTADNAISGIIGMLPARLYEAWDQTDGHSLEVHKALARYREIHPKPVTA